MSNIGTGTNSQSKEQLATNSSRGAYIDDVAIRRDVKSGNKSKILNHNSNSGLLSRYTAHQQTALTDQSTELDRRVQTRQGGRRVGKLLNSDHNARSDYITLAGPDRSQSTDYKPAALCTVSSSDIASQSFIAIKAQQPDLLQFADPSSRNNFQQMHWNEDQLPSDAFGLNTDPCSEKHNVSMGRRTAMQNRAQNKVSNLSGAYSLEPTTGADGKNMAARPSTQSRKPATRGVTLRNGLGTNRAQTAAMQTAAHQQSQYQSQAVMCKSTILGKKNRIFQKPMDHSNSFTSANLKIKQLQREISGNRNNRSSRETGIDVYRDQQYKLVLSRTDLALKKLKKNLQGRNQNQARTAHGNLNQLASMKPEELAEVRDQHLMEASISAMPKTSKSGLFEKAARSSSPQLNSSQLSLELERSSMKKRQSQERGIAMQDSGYAIQISNKNDNTFALLNISLTNANTSPYESQNKTSVGKMPHSLLYAKTKNQRKQNEQHVKVLQSEMKELTSMEPYAHRMKRQFELQQQGKAESGSLIHEAKAEVLLPTMCNKQIEQWLNETLEFQLQEEHEEQMRYWNELTSGQLSDQMPIPMKPRIVKPLTSLEIDRIALDKAGVQQNYVDRLYRGLYAGSVGMFDTIRTSILTVPEKNRYHLMGRLWSVFQMLLQHCCPSNFKMIGRKLVEDQMTEINKVKREFSTIKEKLIETVEKLENELSVISRENVKVQEERDVAERKRQDAEKRLNSIQQKHEEEIRLRLDFELKINKLHNLTMALRNRENALNSKIEELEYDMSQYKARLKTQQEEIVKLRSLTLQQELEKQLDVTKIESVVANEKETKEKLFKVTENMQEKDLALSKKTNLNMKLQTAVDQRESKIRALQDMIEDHERKDKQTDEQQEQYHKQIRLQERSIQEVMQGMTETDEQLATVRRKFEEKSFNAFEYQMAVSRTKDLEVQLDKLLESTTDQRKVIEDFKEEIQKKKSHIDLMIRKDHQNTSQIVLLQGTTAKLTRDLKVMTGLRDEFKKQKEDLDVETNKQMERIKEYDRTQYRLRTQIDQLEKKLASTENLQSNTHQQLEVFKRHAQTWEEKFHKLAIEKDKISKVAADQVLTIDDFKDKLTVTEVSFKEMAGNLRTEQATTEGELNDMEDRKRDCELRVMKLAIAQNLLNRLVHGLIDQIKISKEESMDWVFSKEIEYVDSLAERDISIDQLKEKLHTADVWDSVAAKKIGRLEQDMAKLKEEMIAYKSSKENDQLQEYSERIEAQAVNEALTNKIDALIQETQSKTEQIDELIHHNEMQVLLVQKQGAEVMVQTDRTTFVDAVTQTPEIDNQPLTTNKSNRTRSFNNDMPEALPSEHSKSPDLVFKNLQQLQDPKQNSRNVSVEQISQQSFGLQNSIVRQSQDKISSDASGAQLTIDHSSSKKNAQMISSTGEFLRLAEGSQQQQLRHSQHSWQEGPDANEQESYKQMVSSPIYRSDDADDSRGEERKIEHVQQIMSHQKPTLAATQIHPQQQLLSLQLETCEHKEQQYNQSQDAGLPQLFQQIVSQGSSKESLSGSKVVFQRNSTKHISNGSEETFNMLPSQNNQEQALIRSVQMPLVKSPPPANIEVVQKRAPPMQQQQQPKKPNVQYASNIKGLIRSAINRP